jgi:hypothetical protein
MRVISINNRGKEVQLDIHGNKLFPAESEEKWWPEPKRFGWFRGLRWKGATW